MIQITNVNKKYFEKIKVCSESISHAQKRKENNKIRVIIDDYEKIQDIFFNSLKNINKDYKIILVINYDENNLTNFAKNLILIACTNEVIRKVHNSDAKHLILYTSNDYNKGAEENIINYIVNNSKEHNNFWDIFKERVAG